VPKNIAFHANIMKAASKNTSDVQDVQAAIRQIKSVLVVEGAYSKTMDLAIESWLFPITKIQIFESNSQHKGKIINK
jgi:hypothetical protein